MAVADGVALLDIDEAVRMRELGWKKPILLLDGIFKPEGANSVDHFDPTVAAHCSEQIDLLRVARIKRGINIYMKMNSGTNRLAFKPYAFRCA